MEKKGIDLRQYTKEELIAIIEAAIDASTHYMSDAIKQAMNSINEKKIQTMEAEMNAAEIKWRECCMTASQIMVAPDLGAITTQSSVTRYLKEAAEAEARRIRLMQDIEVLRSSNKQC